MIGGVKLGLMFNIAVVAAQKMNWEGEGGEQRWMRFPFTTVGERRSRVWQ